LLNALAARATRMGSRDPEGAAQEAIKRSLTNEASRPAIDYYFRERPEVDVPAWTLLQLLAWLHAVLRFVVREERARLGSRREIAGDQLEVLQPVDPAPSPLQAVIDDEVRAIVDEGLAELTIDYRSVLLLRLEGAKYTEIAARLGVNENTVATWVRRGARELAEYVRARMDGSAASHRVAEASDV
jgi:RNA polymerase sigma factor (sigma-70 family)